MPVLVVLPNLLVREEIFIDPIHGVGLFFPNANPVLNHKLDEAISVNWDDSLLN